MGEFQLDTENLNVIGEDSNLDYDLNIDVKSSKVEFFSYSS